MAPVLNPHWCNRLKESINSGQAIDITISYNKAAQWLISELSSRDKPFRVYSLGAGVKRITTDTDICPCCKMPLNTKE